MEGPPPIEGPPRIEGPPGPPPNPSFQELALNCFLLASMALPSVALALASSVALPSVALASSALRFISNFA